VRLRRHIFALGFREGTGLDIVVLLFEIMRTSHVMGVPHIGLIAVHEVRHCSTNDNTILGVL
jgi:hypothetical protein